MSSTTKTIIKETEEVGERDTPAVLAYRVGQLEIAMKDAALAQRESTESQKTSTKELASKIDEYAHNFATKTDLIDLEKDVDKRFSKIESWMTWVGRTIIGAVLAAVLGLVVFTKGGI